MGAVAVRYVKEETLQPLKATGRFALFGALGSVFVGFGVVLLLLAVLRFLQEQFEVFRGTLSWIPYLIVAVRRPCRALADRVARGARRRAAAPQGQEVSEQSATRRELEDKMRALLPTPGSATPRRQHPSRPAPGSAAWCRAYSGVAAQASERPQEAQRIILKRALRLRPLSCVRSSLGASSHRVAERWPVPWCSPDRRCPAPPASVAKSKPRERRGTCASASASC